MVLLRIRLGQKVLRGAVRRQSRPQNRQRRVVRRHQLAVSHDISVRFGVRVGIAIPRERHLVLQIGVMIRAVAVTTLEQNDRENCANEKHGAQDTNEHEEPGLVDPQVGVAWKLDVLNVVGVESTEGRFAHEGREARLRVVVSGKDRVGAFREQEGGQRRRWDR